MEFTILTYNTGLFFMPYFGHAIGSRYLCPAGYFKKRRDLLPDAIIEVGADIVALQEVYFGRDKKFFLEKLSHIYPYHGTHGLHRLLGLPNSLMMFSKFPITQYEINLYDLHPFMENISNKGIASCSVNIGDTDLHVLHTHMTIGGRPWGNYSPFTCTIRKGQIDQIKRRIGRKRRSLILGDFNMGPHSCPENYQQILDLGYKDTLTQNADHDDHITFDRIDNPLTHSPLDRNSGSRFFDHIFYDDEGDLSVIDSKIVLDEKIFKTKDGKLAPLSDHYGVWAKMKLN
jgi:endonuclease/exonuclease/phosphatase family metal-dependent hydrolase